MKIVVETSQVSITLDGTTVSIHDEHGRHTTVTLSDVRRFIAAVNAAEEADDAQ